MMKYFIYLVSYKMFYQASNRELSPSSFSSLQILCNAFFYSFNLSRINRVNKIFDKFFAVNLFNSIFTILGTQMLRLVAVFDLHSFFHY